MQLFNQFEGENVMVGFKIKICSIQRFRDFSIQKKRFPDDITRCINVQINFFLSPNSKEN